MSLLPTRRLALVAAVLAVAFLFYPREDVPVLVAVGVVSGLLVLVGLLDGLVATSPKQLTLRRQHPPVVVAGQEATVQWEVRSSSTRSLRISLADELSPSLRARARRFSVRVPPGGTARVTTRIQPLRR
jgi:uncharacterized protein (DUF58 family)